MDSQNCMVIRRWIQRIESINVQRIRKREREIHDLLASTLRRERGLNRKDQ